MDDFVWEVGFSYKREEMVEVNGMSVKRIHIIPDSKGQVPPINNQVMLGTFEDQSRPCEIFYEGRKYLSNVHRFKKS